MMDNPDVKPESTGSPLTLQVGSSIKYRRLDKYLQGRFSNYSRRFLQDVIKSGQVKIKGKTVKPSYKLSPGEVIDIILPEPQPKEIAPEDIALDIIFEDQDLIILNKPTDMIVHPARAHKSGTLVNALAFHCDKLSSGLGEFRPGIVHRLDRNTTGVMAATKNDMAQWKIAKQFENREVHKEYLAIAHGTPQLHADRINAPLGVHPRIREKYAVRPETGKESTTFYEVLEDFQGFSLLKLTPKTGRTHQIRVHLSHIKHPIIADDMYGGKLVYPWQLQNAAEPVVQEPVISRCALHAWTLEFKHPTTEHMVKFEAPLPDDMQTALDMLRKYRSV